MVWRNCSKCPRSYNDDYGGCTNDKCVNFDPEAVKKKNAATTKSVPTSAVQGKSSNTTIISSNRKLPDIPKTAPTITSNRKLPDIPKTHTLEPPTILPSALVSNPNSPVISVVPDPEIVPWIATQTTQSGQHAPKGIELKAEPFTLACYRGEKSEWWPEPRMRLAAGEMYAFEPWPEKNIVEIWAKLVEEIKKEAGDTASKKVAAYAQTLRQSGKPYALAAARTKGGAFEGYIYEIEIKNARTFYWGANYTLGPPANFKGTEKTMIEGKPPIIKDTIDADYIVLNADTIAASTILGVGHKTGTYEVTFLRFVPLSCIKLINGAKPPIPYTEEQLKSLPDGKDKQTALKLFGYK